MMRAFGKLAGLAAVVVAAPASAQITQYSSNVSPVPGAFTHFDSSLGTLTGVSLMVNATDNRSGFASGPGSVSWSVDGTLYLTLSQVNGISLPQQALALAGHGTVGMGSFGTFNYSASGSGTFNLDPSFFLYDSPLAYDFTIAALDNGLFNGADTSFGGSATAAALGGTCFGGVFRGGLQCNSVQYTLTYNYEPLSAVTPVPEPATWTMMLMGFMAVGCTLRGRHRLLPA